MSTGHTSEINRHTDYNTAKPQTHPDIQRARTETLDAMRPEPEPHVCPFGNTCSTEALCTTCQVSLNAPLTPEQKAEGQRKLTAYQAKVERLNRESPKALIADKPFWDSLSIRERDYVMRHVPKPVCVPCWPMMQAHEYVWLQKAANKIGGADADEKLLAEWALEGLQRHMELEREYAEAQKSGESSKVPGPPVTTELPF